MRLSVSYTSQALTDYEQKCGRFLYDDFQEVQPGAAAKLEQELNRHGSAAQDGAGNKGAAVHGSSGASSGSGASWLGTIMGTISHLKGSKRDQSPSLPLHKGQNGQLQTSDSPNSQVPPQQIFLLLCIPYRKYGTKLIHMDIATIQSDQDMFRELKNHYSAIRGRMTFLLSLQKLKCIRFVQFEVYRSELADIRKQHDIPPEDKAHEYRYRPIPAEVIPPVGENHMMHLYEHPEDAEETGDCLDKVPKKLRDRLLVNSGQRTKIGWGVYFIEGLHWMKVWVIGFVGLLASVAFGLCWAAVRNDIQGGFAVTGCMMMLLTFTVGIVQTAMGPS